MPKIPDVVDGEPIESAWGNQSIRDRTVQRMTNEADRDASIPAPGDGETVWIQDLNELQVWAGTRWVTIVADFHLDAYLRKDGGTMDGSYTYLFPLGANFVSYARTDANVYFRIVVSSTDMVLQRSTDGITWDSFYEFDVNDRDARFFGSLRSNQALYAANIPTTGAVANTFYYRGGAGAFQESTSARRYKSNIEPAPWLADLDLEPVTFHHDGDDIDYIGFIADDVADQDGRAGIYTDDGEIQNYDIRAVVAILAAKVNRLETRLAALET